MNVLEMLKKWIPTVTGKYINMDWNPTNQGFGAQCWDVSTSWSRYLGLPTIHTGGAGRWPGWAGNMVDAFPQTEAIANAYILVNPNAIGMPGDIPVWDDSNTSWYPKTHVAVLVEDQGGFLLCISQNSSKSRGDNPYPQWSTGPTILQHLARKGLIGFIRPRLGLAAMGITTPSKEEEEEDDMFTQDDRDDLKRNKQLLLSLQDAITDPITGYVGQAAHAILAAGTGPIYVKGDAPGEQSIYELVDNKLRGVSLKEYEVAYDAGARYRLVDQTRLDKLEKI